MKNRTRGQSWTLIGLSLAPALASVACEQGQEGAPNEVVSIEDYLGRGEPVTRVEDYETFADPGGYTSRWFPVHEFYGIGEPASNLTRSFDGGQLYLAVPAFSPAATFDLVWDHMKYFEASTRSFTIPTFGAVTFSADIRATSPGATRWHRIAATGRPLLEGQQGAATLDVVDADSTGLHFAWWVSEHKAFALYERVFPNGECATGTGFTQIVREIDITPGVHNYGIHYRRNLNNPAVADQVGWIFDGAFLYTVDRVGIPLDVQFPTRFGRMNYNSLGPGEELKNRLQAFSIGHGLGTMVDEFPFNLCPTNRASVPADQRAFGQGVTATFDNFRVTTQTPAS